ncbi:protein transport protein SEC16B homolog isoform X2 [Phragmites australis]|uniref:protein transport protein SEC16B homolog isoform X2 n=1 Tax=Phragmites australis TaxID=29695 RepID=UPI002D76A448|nr:protein transport protein SEC16B homolog isoform X2 [Phragmites australis]
MASSSFAPDDQTDANFFDKLVVDDDDDDNHLSSAPVPTNEDAALARALSSISLADHGPDPPVPEAPAPPPATDAAPPEGGSPGSGKGGGVHTAVKQVQWASFGGGADDGVDPFADLSGGAGDDGFFGTVAGNQTQETSVGVSDHGFFGGNQSLATEVTDRNFFGGSSNQNTGGGLLERSSSGAVDSTDPKYLETMYPGWKYDEATQQWYQVDSFYATGNAAQVDSSSQNVQQQQQQQQLDTSYLQNSAHAALETIAEEGTTTGGASSWGQGSDSEYPPNVLFYAEYPGWYFDTNTQQWHSLESYQQAAMQAGTASAVQNGANHGVVAASGGMDYNVKQTEDLAVHNQVAQHNSFTNSYAHQSQWKADAFGNTMRSESIKDGSLTGSFYGFDQHANAETISSSTSHQVGFSTVETATDHYGGHKGLESLSLQSGYNSTDRLQSSYKAFEPSTGYQAGYKGFQPATGHQTSHTVLEQSTGNQGGHKAFEPSMGNQNHYKPFEPSTGHQSGYKGFVPSTGHQAGYKGSEASTVQQASYKGFETSTGHNTSFKGFEPSSAQQAGFMGSQPSSGHQSNYKGFETSANQGYGDVNGVVNTQSFVPMESMYHGQKQANANPQGHLSNSYLGTENSMNFNQQQFLGANASQLQFGPPHEGRSSAGRPPHALVAFGFGGKLIVMKETSSMTTNFNSGSQNSSATVSVLNLSEVVDKVDPSSVTNSSALSYFHALCRQPVPGPLVGGNAASKDVNKWLDEMIAWYESSASDFQKGDPRKLLISLLKILCQHYGKLRSPFGSDPSQEETDGPEMAVTKLFSSCKRSSVHMGGYGSIVHCMKNIPSESQMQAIAQEVQNLLVSGRRKEALQCAQGGQLWGPAIILALQLGDKFYVDTVKKMARSHFVSGSPLRTLCLLIAGQPADVFNVEDNINSDYGTVGASHQPMEPGPNGMLDDWEENLAIITANRTKGDDLVITHLGDCLWKEKAEVAAAHSCYLVAELNIDSYSESARLCLIGADHLKCPRTFVSPEAIQRTEVYEYAKVLGNSQYILLPFQPYKLIYAYMLAEVGRISDSLRYCQASMKVLKASGRAPELEAWKQLFSSLEERIRTHQQGGYGTNLAPAKLVGKIFTSLDKSISRMMGTPSAPLPPLPQGSIIDRESYSAPAAAKFVNSQSVMAMSSLMPSASMQSMSEIAENSGGTGRKIAHNRSVSEPDFGRTPKQGAGSDRTQSSASGSGSSRFGWLGSTLQKTMGFVSKSHRQEAKLGDQNKFYYDEKLKRWVEEGAAIPTEEPPLPPPPTKSSFQNGMPDHKLNGPMSASHAPNGVTEWKSSSSSEQGLGMPPIPPSQNQFSARGRMGVRSRYVDTFNKGGASGAVPSYNKPAAPSVTPPVGAKFFVPTAAAAATDQMPLQAAEIHSETVHQDERSASLPAETSYSSPPPSTQFSAPMSSTIHRHPSMDNISTPYQGSGVSSESNSSSFSRSRAASWSGTYSEQFSAIAGVRSPDDQTMPLPLMPGKPSHSRSNSNSSVQFNGLTEDLHEVEL